MSTPFVIESLRGQQILKNLKFFGLALTIPSILVCGPLLGYLLAIALIKNGLPSFVLPFFVGAGSILALVQVFRTAKIIARLSEKTKND